MRRCLLPILLIVFVQLTDPHNGRPVFVNPALIATIRPNGDAGTVIDYAGGGWVNVQEQADEIFRRLTDIGFARK